MIYENSSDLKFSMANKMQCGMSKSCLSFVHYTFCLTFKITLHEVHWVCLGIIQFLRKWKFR